jgi:hypothetical protein
MSNKYISVFFDSFTEKEVKVFYKGKTFFFEFLTGCGWVSALPDGQGSPKHTHPNGAWEELQKIINPNSTTEEGELIDKAWVIKNDPKYAHTWDWDEHPEDYDDACYCALCRSYV